MMKALYYLAAAGCCLIVGTATANNLNYIPLEQQFARADVVIVTGAIKNTFCAVDGTPRTCTELKDVVFLKGISNGTVERL
jgi:hypothetical protein